MAQVCVGNSKLERHCSKESAEQDQDKKAACSLEGVRGEHTAVMQGWADDWGKEKKQQTEIISQGQSTVPDMFCPTFEVRSLPIFSGVGPLFILKSLWKAELL